jgi:hypothetical protein
MSIGNFSETSESKNEVNEANESVDNTEKPGNQILETPDSYKDDFESRMDSKESKEGQETEHTKQGDDSGESKEEKGDSDKTSLLDKMRNLFKKKEDGENQQESKKVESSVDGPQPPDEGKSEMSFKDSLKPENWKSAEGDERTQKVEAFNSQMDDSVIAHGKMLSGRSDLSPDEKKEMQAEMTENASKAKQEFHDALYGDNES